MIAALSVGRQCFCLLLREYVCEGDVDMWQLCSLLVLLWAVPMAFLLALFVALLVALLYP